MSYLTDLFEKTAAPLNMKWLKNPLTHADLLPQGQKVMRRLAVVPRVMGGVGGTVGGGVAGYNHDIDPEAEGAGKTRLKNTLIGAGAGGVTGLAAGFGVGKLLPGLQMRRLNKARQNIVDELQSHKDSFKENYIKPWRGLQSEIQQRPKEYFSTVPKHQLHPELQKAMDEELKSSLYAKSQMKKVLRKGDKSPTNVRASSRREARIDSESLQKHVQDIRSGQAPTFRKERFAEHRMSRYHGPFEYSQPYKDKILRGDPYSPTFNPKVNKLYDNLVEKHKDTLKGLSDYQRDQVLHKVKSEAYPWHIEDKFTFQYGDASLRTLNHEAHNMEDIIKRRFNQYSKDFEGAFHGSEKNWDDFKSKKSSGGGDYWGGDGGGGSRSGGAGRAYGGDIDSALKTLGVDKSSTKSQKELSDAWKKLARQHHPDMGGNLEMMQKINGAMDEIKKSSWFSGLKK